jgi:D-glycero-alpha-D-manno-heptose 1-phosphate guanylyltransferase
VIEEYVSNEFRTSDITFSIEKEPLGTGGAIKLACDHASEKTVLVLNGDTFFRVDLDKLTPFHHMCGADCTLSLKPIKNFDRYGVVGLNKDYSIESFREKKYYSEGLINGGVYALNIKKFQQEHLPEKFSFEKDYLEAFYLERRMYGVIQDEYFIDIGIPEDYERAQRELVANV